jgi:hypothetical protein
VQWVAGPQFANVSSQYYNWSVAVPGALARGEKAAAVPLELTLHRDADSYWRTQFRMERNSVVLAPHDFPIRSEWYGYHESLGTLKSYSQGVIRPYTERRLLAFIDWAAKKWPIERNKIIVTGCRDQASGSGALHLGLRHPEVFALVVSGHGSPTYADLAGSTDRGGLSEPAKGLQAAFGHPDWNLKTDGGKSVWEEHDMNRLAAATPAAAELPLVAITSGKEGSIRKFHRVMLESGRPIIAEFSWGGGRYIPVTASETFPNAVRLDIRQNLSMLAFNCEAARKTLTGGMGEFNRDVTWRNPVEGPDKYEVIIRCLAEQASAYDVTLRRLQRFKVEPGKTYRWVIAPVDDGQDLSKPARRLKSAPVDLPPSTQGDAVATKDGVLTLKAVPPAGEVRLTVAVK